MFSVKEHGAAYEKWTPLLSGLCEDELMVVVSIISHVLLIPNWFCLRTLRTVLDCDDITEEQFRLFHKYVEQSNCANMVMEEMDFLWGEMVSDYEDADWEEIAASINEVSDEERQRVVSLFRGISP